MNTELLEYKLKGYCCSQIVTKMCLERMGRENQEMVDASAGFCFGLGIGANCGIVTAAMAILYLDDAKEATERRGQEFLDWFIATFESIECEELLEGNPLNKVEKCPGIIEASINQLEEILEWE